MFHNMAANGASAEQLELNIHQSYDYVKNIAQILHASIDKVYVTYLLTTLSDTSLR